MSYWVREIAGWLLVLIGLFLFWQTYSLLLQKRVFSAGPSLVMGYVVFRGGIHLLKVAVAAQAARNLTGALTAAGKSPPRAVARPVGPTPAQQILPGPKTSRQTGPPAGRR